MGEKSAKNNRTLSIYSRLCEGKVISKAEEADRFGVDERSIQRDIDDIRAFLDERRVSSSSDQREILYDRIKKGFVMAGAEGSQMSNSEILAVSKILLESRAFTRDEIDGILDKLVLGCVPAKNMKLVSDLIANEKYHYVELCHKSGVQDKLWGLGEAAKNCRQLQIKYLRGTKAQDVVTRVVEPVAIMFSEYYFYLNAFIVEQDAAGKFVHKYDYPAIFRIDRIKEYGETGERFRINYADRFEEGEFRKRIQFMYPGKLMKIRLRYSGENPEPVLDRLPTAKVVGEDEKGFLIEAEVYGKGILMWILSQGERVEVLKPDGLREEVREKVDRIGEMYVGGNL